MDLTVAKDSKRAKSDESIEASSHERPDEGTAEPGRPVCREDRVRPECRKSRAEGAGPVRTELLVGRAKPRIVWSGTDKKDSKQLMPHGENAEPEQANIRSNRQEPKLEKDCAGSMGPGWRRSGAEAAKSECVRLRTGTEKSEMARSDKSESGPILAQWGASIAAPTRAEL